MQKLDIDTYIQEQIDLLVGFKIWWKINSENNSEQFPGNLTPGEWDEQIRIFDDTLLLQSELKGISIKAVREYELLGFYALDISKKFLDSVGDNEL